MDRPRYSIRSLIVPMLALLVACGGAPPDPAELEYQRVKDPAALIALLQDEDPVVRARTARAMGRLQDGAYVNALGGAMSDVDPLVRREAWFALGQLGLAQGTTPPQLAADVAGFGIQHDDPEIVAQAVEALGKLAPPDAAGAIVPLMQHADADVRVQTAHALFRLRFVPTWRGEADEPPALPTEAVTALAAALGDEDDDVRRAAAHALSRYGEQDAVAAQIAVAADADAWVRTFAVRGVGRAGTAEVAEQIVWGLHDVAGNVRAETVTALGALGRADLVPASLDRDPAMLVRLAVATVLAGDDDPASIKRLRDLDDDAAPGVRAAAVQSLAVRLGATYLEQVERHFADERWTLRAAAVQAAGTIGEPALELLIDAADDADGRVRTAVLEALAPFLDRTRPTAIFAAALASDDLAERATAVDELAGAEHPDRLALLSAVYDRSPGVGWVEVRELAIDGLADLSTAGELLRRAAQQDPAPSVRTKARQALDALGIEAPPAAVESTPLYHEIETFAEDPRVVLETSKGSMEIVCFPDDAPVHVSNFIKLVREGFYDGLIWHRLAPNFVIQGGDPLGSGWGGPGYALPDEINRRRYERGTVGMPKAGKDTGGCQIFITHVPTPHLDGNYTVFGRVVSGLEVIDEIEVGDTITRAYVK